MHLRRTQSYTEYVLVVASLILSNDRIVDYNSLIFYQISRLTLKDNM